MKRKRPSYFLEENDLVNLTPLLDVLFVVLMLFILIAPLVNIDRISLTESSSKRLTNSSMNQQEAISIFLHEDGKISVNEKLIEKYKLKILLTQMYKKNSKILPKLFIDKKATFGAFTEIKDLVEESGFESLDLIVKSKHP
jgi:biopolymer transport protein ExbD